MTLRLPKPAVSALVILMLGGASSAAWRTQVAADSSTPRHRPVVAIATSDALAEVQQALDAGRAGEAMRRIDVLIASQPGDARLRFQKGVMLVDQKRGGEAIAVFQKLMRDFPALPEPMNNLAVLYVERGDMEKARTTLEAAIRSKPNYGTAFQNLGDLYSRMASRAYARALQIDDAEGAPKLALIRSLYEAPPPDADGALMAQVRTQPPARALTARIDSSSPAITGNAAMPTSSPTNAAAARVAGAAPASSPSSSKPSPPVTMAPPLVIAQAAPAASRVAPAPLALPALLAPSAPPAPPAAAMAKPAAATSAASPSPSRPAAPASAVGVSRAAPAGSTPAAAAVDSAAARQSRPSAPATPSAGAAGEQADVQAALRAWAGAWSRRDMSAYIGSYVPGFKGAEASADVWQAGRRARILGKSSIRLDVSAIKVEFDKGVALATFRQSYAAGELEVSSRKTLEFVRVNGRWLIRRESVGG